MKFKKIHFVGVKGVGVAPLAIIAKEAGIEVTGSDVSDHFITDKQLIASGINPIEGFNKSNVNDPDLVITTGAHGGLENVEVIEAKEKNIPVMLQGEALGKFQDGEIFNKKFLGVSVAGSHGKTTTTAIIATILAMNNLDPSYVIGTGEIPTLKNSGHFGKGNYFISEADEYFADVKFDRIPKFLYQNPKVIIITNIDFDHPDVFENHEVMEKAFYDFTKKLTSDGALIICGDGENNRKFISNLNQPSIRYGFSPDNDYVIEKINYDCEKMFFWVKSKDTMLGEFSVNVFGEHNALNCLGAIIVCLELGLSIDQIRRGLSEFKGTKRRAEFIGKIPTGAILYDDYAHHPSEVKETLHAFRKSFPKQNIVTVFQPHMYSRTKTLFENFVNSFNDSDEIIITEIFPSFREPIDPNFSSKQIVDELIKKQKNAIYFPSNLNVIEYISSQNYSSNTVIITMGAGDIYKIGEKLING